MRSDPTPPKIIAPMLPLPAGSAYVQRSAGSRYQSVKSCVSPAAHAAWEVSAAVLVLENNGALLRNALRVAPKLRRVTEIDKSSSSSVETRRLRQEAAAFLDYAQYGSPLRPDAVEHVCVRIRRRRVCHWQNGVMVRHWMVWAFLRTEKRFNKIMGYSDLWALESILLGSQSDTRQAVD
jgi:hypothetical protein